ncbi:2Fe-2S iron-sulfur cluster-binding protein [Dasania marina]|uniref:2Fe-2S iron-sulfur cluster-binding protein n=1 Tax=Dasania marina TaxID=471499 RepID=UPI000368709D|nr:2Fe-2S iron-sulfur cluster-binding protein [Dasania marina]
MPTITYIEANGEGVNVEVPTGNTLMQGAVDNSVAGILAQCGGVCSCGTCHCYIDAQALSQFPAPDNTEKFLIKMTHNPLPNSRLSCQVIVTEAMEGLVVKLPEFQT